MRKAALLFLLAGCAQELPTEERVIHILVEGGECETPAPTPTAVIAATLSPATVISTEIVMVPVPRSTLPAGSDEKRVAVLSKLRAVATTLERKDMDYHDVPAVAEPMRKAYDLLPKLEFADAMFHAEVAEDAAREATLNLDAVDRRLKRVQKRLEEAAPKLADKKTPLDKDWQTASALMVANNLARANQKLEAIEEAINEAEGIARAP